jgi:hypothetical protein
MDLTPDAQLHLAQRIADMIDKWGPFMALTVLILIVYRKEIGGLIVSLRREHVSDALLTQINASFANNLEYFRQTVEDLRAIKASNQKIADEVQQAIEVGRSIRDEIIRGRR